MEATTERSRRVRADEAQPGDEVRVDYRDGARWGVVLYTLRKPGRVVLTVSVLDEAGADMLDMDQAIHSTITVR